MIIGGLRKIKTEILTKVIMIVLFSICTSVAYNYISGKQAAINNAAKSIEKINSSVIYQSSNFLLGARNLAQDSAAFLTNEENVSLDNLDSLKHYMFSVLKSHTIISSLSVALEKGFFLNVDKIAHDPSVSKKSNLPENVFFVVKVIKEGFNYSSIDVQYYTKNLELIDVKLEKPITPIADFRKLAWYENTFNNQKTFFSDLHILQANDIPGVTATAPITTKNGHKLGVFAVDISVDELSNFINEMRPTDYSRSFIIDKTSKIIADSDMDETFTYDKDNNANIKTVQTLNDKSLGMALDEFKNGVKSKDLPDNIFNLSTPNNDYIVSVSDFPSSLGLAWQIVSLTPSAVFTADAFAIQRNSVYLALVILLLAVIVVYFQAQKFSEPIVNLAEEAKKIQSLELDNLIFLNSNITEIHDLTNTMHESQKNLLNFSKYVPKGLVKQFIENKKEVSLGGETHEVTLMFTDVANFTTVSEGLAPQDLMLHLSEYFEELTTIILDNRGTVDKFIGDAIMVFWGAPVLNPNQTIDACRSALLCHQALKNMNGFWKEIGKPPLVTRFGINYGHAVIGNVGSSERMNYTAIGDAVNLSARLEGTNKMYGTNIIISDSAYARLDSSFIVRPLDIVAVKGKEKGTKIFELVGRVGDEQIYPVSDATLKFCEEFTNAFDLYIEQKWAKAKKAFEALEVLNKETKHPDHAIAMYIERCKNFINNPPGDDWDGVVHLKEK
jgi:adenylate cyclase